jgi:hypothetical protein
MSRHLLSLGALVAAATIVAGTSTSRARAKANPLAGTYQFTGDQESGERAIEEAAKGATEGVFFAIRGTVRSRLLAKNRLALTLQLAFPPGQITTIFDRNRTYLTPEGGAAVAVTLPDGEQVELSQSYENGVLTQVFTGKDGERRNVFRMLSDGHHLELQVTVQSSKLTRPMGYRLVYTRVTD